MSRLALVLVGLVLAGGAHAAEPIAIPLVVPLVVADRAAVARTGFPASASVPFPRGRLRDPATLGLVDPGGHATVLQTRVLERWPDGTIRWLLLDFLADVPAGAHATYTLREHAGTPPAKPRLRSSVRDGARIVDTGTLRLVVEPAGDAFTLARPDGRQVGPIHVPALRIGDGAPARFTPAHVTVETDGPVRTELLLTGRYGADVASELRVAVFAGQPLVRLEHTVTSLSDQLYLPVRALALAVPGTFDQAALGVAHATHAVQPLDHAVDLSEDDPDVARLDGATVGRSDGWAELAGANGAVTVVVPYFWEEYPQGLRVAPDGLTVDLFAGAATPVRLGAGAAKTHEVWLALGTGLRPPDLAAALRDPLVAVPPARWTVASRALPQALAPDTAVARGFLASLSTAYARYRAQLRTERWDDVPPNGCTPQTPPHVRVGLYGVFNWGDWQFPGLRSKVHGCEAWGNLEYDLTQVLALGWVATGSPEFHDGLEAAARHYRDVDIIHHAPGHPEWVGMNHPHKSGHFSFETAEKVDLGHTWTEGLVTYARLTGDVRALAAARGIADVLSARIPLHANPRQYGWPMIALVGVWDATGEARYRERAADFARAAVEAFRPDVVGTDWKIGILADGIAATHAATGDASLRRWLVAYADTLVAAPGRYQDARFWLPVGYVAALTGDRRYVAAARAAAAGLKIGAWGKPLAIMGRTGFRLLAPLADMPDMAPPTSDRPPAAVKPGRDAPRPGSRDVRRAPSPSRAAPDPPDED